MNNSFLKKKSFGDKKINSQPSTENTAESELMSDQATIDQDETPEQRDSDQQDQEGLQGASSDTEESIHPGDKRSASPTNPSPRASSDPKAATPSRAKAVSGLNGFRFGQPSARTKPTVQTPTTDQPDNISAVQNGQQDDSFAPSQAPLAPLAPPLPPPTQEQQAILETGQQRRTRRPPQDGKKSLVARIDVNLHKRVIMAAETRDLSMTDMVILMIEHCCPAP